MPARVNENLFRVELDSEIGDTKIPRNRKTHRLTIKCRRRNRPRQNNSPSLKTLSPSQILRGLWLRGSNGAKGGYSIPVAPMAYQVVLEPGIGQFREFEPSRVHTQYEFVLFLVHKVTCEKRESVS